MSETEETAYCPDCDITIGEAHTTWFNDRSYGIAECPLCDQQLQVQPVEDDGDYDIEALYQHRMIEP